MLSPNSPCLGEGRGRAGHDRHRHQWEIVGRLALAAVLGALIGLEREYRGYPAGVRTMALVCMGSALFGDMSRIYGGDDRIAAQIVTGIGFLGAGLIFREGFSVKGVTTAATIWAVAAVGIAVAIEAYIVAVFARSSRSSCSSCAWSRRTSDPTTAKATSTSQRPTARTPRPRSPRQSPQGSRRVDKDQRMTTDTAPKHEQQAERYDPQAIEPKWRARWEADGLYATATTTRARSGTP